MSAGERGNAATAIDRRRGDGTAWTSGNQVVVHIDGADYFHRLRQVLEATTQGDRLCFTDWEGHADERLDGVGSEFGTLVGSAADRGVDVRGLLWRSHPKQAHFDEQSNMGLARDVNERGATLALDERVRRGGSHHQKLVVVTGPTPTSADVAFVGGIDLCHGRRDTSAHEGDAQATEELDAAYGHRPPWHDLQLEVRGPAIGDLAWTFRERWNDPSPLDHRNPLRALQRRLMRQPASLTPLPEPANPEPVDGSHHVQVLRTYPARRPAYSFAPDGEQSIARAYLKAIGRARRLVVIEDQYLWSMVGARALGDALRRHPNLQVVIVVPRYPDQDGVISGRASAYGRNRVLDLLRRAGGRRVAVYDLVNAAGTPIYVHAKVCIIDDVWIEIGSDNFNRRSWTHDSELGCAVLDDLRDPREPSDPGGHGDGARVLPRQTRLALWCEHLGRPPGDDADLVDPGEGFAALERSARALSEWEVTGRGPRPPGHLAVHRPAPLRRGLGPVVAATYRLALDPDGSPRSARPATGPRVRRLGPPP